MFAGACIAGDTYYGDASVSFQLVCMLTTQFLLL